MSEGFISIPCKRAEAVALDRAVLDFLRHQPEAGADVAGDYTAALAEINQLRQSCLEKVMPANEYNLKAILR